MFRLRIKYWTPFQGVVYHNKSSSVDLFDSRVPKDPSTSLLETLEDMAANRERWRSCCHFPSNQSDRSVSVHLGCIACVGFQCVLFFSRPL